MIKYYAYYNHGGYKDFYIGSQEEDVQSKYFLPLLVVYEHSLAENPDNEELRANVEHQKSLPKIIALSDKTVDYNYPSSARVLMSHGGYKILYKCIGHSLYALSIRDIVGHNDVYGRQTPFNLMLIGNEPKDIRDLDIIAEYIRKNISIFEKEIGSIFVDDIIENGLRCNIGILRDKLNEIIENGSPLTVNECMPSVRMLIVTNRNMLNIAIKEQNIRKEEINICYQSDGALLFSMSSRHQDDISDFRQETIHSAGSTDISTPMDTHSTPSVRDMFNIAKREDVEQLWKYVTELEKRIEELEKRINHE